MPLRRSSFSLDAIAAMILLLSAPIGALSPPALDRREVSSRSCRRGGWR
jgi:hypothetical protein